jgi:hypothetical protein
LPLFEYRTADECHERSITIYCRGAARL